MTNKQVVNGDYVPQEGDVVDLRKYITGTFDSENSIPTTKTPLQLVEEVLNQLTESAIDEFFSNLGSPNWCTYNQLVKKTAQLDKGSTLISMYARDQDNLRGEDIAKTKIAYVIGIGANYNPEDLSTLLKSTLNLNEKANYNHTTESKIRDIYQCINERRLTKEDLDMLEEMNEYGPRIFNYARTLIITDEIQKEVIRSNEALLDIGLKLKQKYQGNDKYQKILKDFETGLNLI